MVRKKYTEEQAIAVLKEAEAGSKLPDLCRKYGMSDATYSQLESQILRNDYQRSEAASKVWKKRTAGSSR